jgi:hypothetical protein
MDEDVITDLKQFIAATVSQHTSELDKKMDKLDQRIEKLDGKVDTIDKKIDDLSTSVADALDTNNDVSEAQSKDYGRRLTRLEQKLA